MAYRSIIRQIDERMRLIEMRQVEQERRIQKLEEKKTLELPDILDIEIETGPEG